MMPCISLRSSPHPANHDKTPTLTRKCLSSLSTHGKTPNAAPRVALLGTSRQPAGPEKKGKKMASLIGWKYLKGDHEKPNKRSDEASKKTPFQRHLRLFCSWWPFFFDATDNLVDRTGGAWPRATPTGRAPRGSRPGAGGAGPGGGGRGVGDMTSIHLFMWWEV